MFLHLTNTPKLRSNGTFFRNAVSFFSCPNSILMTEHKKQCRDSVGATSPPHQSLENIPCALWRMENITPPHGTYASLPAIHTEVRLPYEASHNKALGAMYPPPVQIDVCNSFALCTNALWCLNVKVFIWERRVPRMTSP